MINIWNNNLNPLTKIFSYEFLEFVDCDPHINIWGEFLIVFEGSILTNIYDNEYCVSENEVIFINSLIPHDFKSKGNCKAVVISFSMLAYETLFSSLKNTLLKRQVTKLSQSHINYIKECLETKTISPVTNQNLAISIISGILSEITNENEIVNINNNNNTITIAKALEFLLDHYNENLQVKDVAKYLCVNPGYLSQLFSHHLNTTVIDILNSMRIYKATLFLKQTNKTISTIALECGFNSTRTFNRLFKKHIDMSPSQYRKTPSIPVSNTEKIDIYVKK